MNGRIGPVIHHYPITRDTLYFSNPAMIGRVLTFMPIARVNAILFLQMIMRRGKLVAKTENGLGRIQTIGPDAGQKSQNEAADKLSHGRFPLVAPQQNMEKLCIAHG